MTSLFIADLHLCKEEPAITQLFVDFMQHRARQAKTLYILGDLFEAWLGDDALLPEHEAVIAALQSATADGLDIAFMHGNRDFLIGKRFSQLTGCRLIDDPTPIELNNEAVLLMHGDTLCTDDIDYQRFRQQVRTPEFQQQVMAMTLEQRLAKAQQYRQMSQNQTRLKPQDIIDVNEQTVIDVMTQWQTTTLIHGHTHRPACHNLVINKQPARRYVLADWSAQQGHVLKHDSSGYQIETFDTASV